MNPDLYLFSNQHFHLNMTVIYCFSFIKKTAISKVSSQIKEWIYPSLYFGYFLCIYFAGMTLDLLCDVEVNLCYSSPCHMNSTCVQQEGGYVCLCPEGFTGKKKKVFSHCTWRFMMCCKERTIPACQYLAMSNLPEHI